MRRRRATRSIPNKSERPVAGDGRCRRARASQPSSDSARIYKGTGVVVKGMQPGGTLPPGPPGAGRGRRRDPQFRGRRPARSRPQHPGRHPQRELHDRPGRRRHGDHPHVDRHTARRADRDARNAAARQRRHDGQERRPVPGRAAGGGHARQHGASAGQFDARAAAGFLGADRSAALRGRQGNDAAAGAVRQGRAGGAPG